MGRAKKVLRRVFCLPLIPTLLIALPSLVLCFVALAIEVPRGVDYVAYALSAYGVALLSTLVYRALRQRTPLAESKALASHPRAQRYLTDPVFRSEVSLYTGTALNVAYVVMKLAYGVLYRSVWFVALAVYYLFLAIIRFSLLRHLRKTPTGQDYRQELRRYRSCGWLLAGMNIALAAIVTLVVMENQGFHYPGYLIYLMALYAFYAVITSIKQVIQFRRYRSPVLSAAKAVSLTAALVSMLALETAMIGQFGTDSGPTFRRAMTAATGFAVCVFELGLAIYMIVKANRALALTQEKGEKKNG